jgi:predicted nucleic acid-binding protein
MISWLFTKSSGVGFVDIHLLASAQLTGVPLWTADKRLKAAANQLEIAFK